MNLKSLEDNLRAITPSEEKHQNGISFDFSYTFAEEINGQTVYSFDKIQKTKAVSQPNLKLMDRIAGKLYLSKNSRFVSVPMHIHNWVELNYMYSGQCDIQINQVKTTLKTGQMSLIDTKTPHSIGYTGENDILINILIDKQYLGINFFNRLSKDSIVSKFFINAINEHTSHDNFIVFHSDYSRRIPIFMNEFMCEYYDPSLNSADMLDSLLSLIISELINVFENDLNKEQLLQMGKSKVAIIPILRYIEGNFKNCTLETTAAFFNMNPNYLTTLLKQQTGLSYKELILGEKMKHSAYLLRNTNMTVTEIANMVGYENISFFYRKFQQRFHCSPKEYRTKI
jgi:AraC-type DNA-binding domain-containing proteins